MQQPAARATVSDLSHNQRKVLLPVDATDVRITRRDGEDVVVSTVTRVAAERSSIAALTAVMQRTRERTLGDLTDVMLHVYPWTGSLPASDRRAFASRYLKVLAECVAHMDFQPLAILLNQWSYTASVHKDEALLQALLAPIKEDRVTGQRAELPRSRTAARSRRRRQTPARARRR